MCLMIEKQVIGICLQNSDTPKRIVSLTNLYKENIAFPHLTNTWNNQNSIITYRYIGQYQIVNYTSHMNIQVHSLFIAMYYILCQCYMYIWCNISVIKWYAMKSIQIFFLLFFSSWGQHFNRISHIFYNYNKVALYHW